MEDWEDDTGSWQQPVRRLRKMQRRNVWPDSPSEATEYPPFTAEQAQTNITQFLAQGGRPPETVAELVIFRERFYGLKPGEYTGKNGELKRSEISRTTAHVPDATCGHSSPSDSEFFSAHSTAG